MARLRVAVAHAVVLAMIAGAAGDTGAASLALTEAQKAAAVRAGEQSVHAEAFDGEWRVTNGDGEAVVVLTLFHRLANAARQAAFKNEQLSPAAVDRLLRGQDKRLVLLLSLRGPREDFARLYAPRLVLADREIKPAFVQNERTAARQDAGGFLAHCTYGFPTRDLTGTTRFALVVGDGNGRDVRRFTIDLSTMR